MIGGRNLRLGAPVMIATLLLSLAMLGSHSA
jgi:hypothetical protein